MRKTLQMLPVVLLIVLFLQLTTVFAKAGRAEEEMTSANQFVIQAVEQVKMNKLAEAKASFEAFKQAWFDSEDDIKAKSKASYREIEDQMGQIDFALLQKPVQQAKLIEALENQQKINERFIKGDYAPDAPDTADSGAKGDLSSLIGLLQEAKTAVDAGDTAAAKSKVEAFRKSWLDVEGIVLTQSASAYQNAERDMVLLYAYLSSDPVRIDDAKSTMDTMIGYLQPLAAKTTYGMFDAVTIILREGMEALLVVIALLAFLKKSGHDNKKKWVWGGVLGGIGASIVLGVMVQLLFSTGAFGSNNFMIAGFTGLFAAVMLLYMTYWLHSKSSLTQWSQYIRSKSTRALAAGSLWSLAVLAFLAIFREGTETVLFMIGMASSIGIGDLLAGIAIGFAVLAVITILALRYGVKIPIRPFFLISSLLVFYLCFKFAGMGIHGLQLAGLLSATNTDIVTSVGFLAIYPTWEGLVPQMLLIAAAIVIFSWNSYKDYQTRNQMQLTNK